MKSMRAGSYYYYYLIYYYCTIQHQISQTNSTEHYESFKQVKILLCWFSLGNFGTEATVFHWIL